MDVIRWACPVDMRMVAERVGVYRRADLPGTRAEVRRAVAAGQLRRLRHGWYARPDADEKVVRAVTAGGCLTCVSALELHGVWSPPGDRLHLRTTQDLTSKYARCPVPTHEPMIGPVDEPLVAWRAAVRCTSAEYAVAITDSTLRLGLVQPEEVAALPDSLAAVRDWVDPRAEAGTESLVRYRLQRIGIRVTPQVVIEPVGRIDMIVGDRVALECDSREHHTSLDAYRNDRRRDRILLGMGYYPCRLTYEDVMFRWDSAVQTILAVVRRDAHRRRLPKSC